MANDPDFSLQALAASLQVTPAVVRAAVAPIPDMPEEGEEARIAALAEVITQVTPWCGSPPCAFSWYRSQPLPSFGDMTAEDLLRQGRLDALRRYLARVADGGHA